MGAVMFLAGGAAAYYLLPSLLALLARVGLVRRNYRQLDVPTGAGIVLVLAAYAPITALVVVRGFAGPDALLVLYALAAAALLGLVDDVTGEGDRKGLRGHFLALFSTGRLTSGGLKALFAGLVALSVGWSVSPGTLGALRDAALFALAVNSVNLLDLRPGRAIKGFLFGLLAVWLLAETRGELLYTWALAGAAVVFLRPELEERAMLGDAGANVLGSGLGLAAVLSLSPAGRLVALLALAGLHLYCERYSLSELIDRNDVLGYIDRLGRRR